MRVKILVKLIVFFVFLLNPYLTSSYAVENALVNSGFEDGEDNWYNWNENEGTSKGEITSLYCHSGSNSACREISGKGKGCFGQILPVDPGELVKASVWVMNPSSEPLTNGAIGYLRIEFWKVDADAKTPLGGGHLESVYIDKPTKWIKLEVSGKVPGAAQEIRVLSFSGGTNNNSTGKVYFDDFEMTIVSKLH